MLFRRKKYLLCYLFCKNVYYICMSMKNLIDFLLDTNFISIFVAQ